MAGAPPCRPRAEGTAPGPPGHDPVEGGVVVRRVARFPRGSHLVVPPCPRSPGHGVTPPADPTSGRFYHNRGIPRNGAKAFTHALEDEHPIAEAVEAIALADGLLVGAQDEVAAGER
jgi:hypothetical protein